MKGIRALIALTVISHSYACSDTASGGRAVLRASTLKQGLQSADYAQLFIRCRSNDRTHAL